MRAKLLGLALVIILIAVALPAQAQEPENLLQNGGFEGEYVTIRGDVTKLVAAGWEPWNVDLGGDPQGLNREPEYGKAPNNRIHGGEAAQEYNTFFAPHDAGVFQRVNVTPNTKLRFSIFMYIWSTTDFSDVDHSNDPLGVQVQVGIDPTGGTDPQSDAIVWSELREYYDKYEENSIEATSSADAVTVFVRSVVEKENGVSAVYIDDANLVALGSGEVTVTATTPAPEGTTPAPEATTPAPEATTPAPEGTTPAPEATTPAPEATTPVPQGPSATPVPTLTPTPISQDYPNTIIHTVVAGDTISGLAIKYDSRIDLILAANNLSEFDYIHIGQQLTIPVKAGQGIPPGDGTGGGTGGGAGGSVYIVKPGDNLFRIALSFGLTVDELARFNNIYNPALIYVGQEIFIPTAGSAPVGGYPAPQLPAPVTLPGGYGYVIHVVQAGENLFRVGLHYNLTWDIIARANGLYNPNYIFVGQHLVIPRW